MDETQKIDKFAVPASIVIAALIIGGTMMWKRTDNGAQAARADTPSVTSVEDLMEEVLPSRGVTLPITWGDLGSQLVASGVIDEEKFRSLYAGRGGLSDSDEMLLTGENTEPLVITSENAQYLLNLLWALGLASSNPILDSGEMTDPKYGGAQNFASTGGWTLARGNPMDHYSAHAFFNLTPEQQALVDKVSRGIFRPCCGNSTHFPDCNHGMAMLGLLELMASQGIGEEEMYRSALAVNSYWFPDTYRTIAMFLESKDVAWESVPASELLGARFSSSAGFANVKAQITQPQQQQGGGGCSV